MIWEETYRIVVYRGMEDNGTLIAQCLELGQMSASIKKQSFDETVERSLRQNHAHIAANIQTGTSPYYPARPEVWELLTATDIPVRTVEDTRELSLPNGDTLRPRFEIYDKSTIIPKEE